MMFQEKTEATDALVRQMAVMQEAADTLRSAINNLTGSTDPENATWIDVSRFAQMADAAKRFLETVSEGG